MHGIIRGNGNGASGIWKQLSTNLKARSRLRRQQASRARNRQLKYVTSEQLAYADVLDAGVRIGRVFLIIGFAAYVFKLVDPKVPFSELPAYWSMPVATYLKSTGIGVGWSWLGLVGYGDYLNFPAITFLSGLTILCYLRLLPLLLRSRDFALGAILALELAVMLFAASGITAGGH